MHIFQSCDYMLIIIIKMYISFSVSIHCNNACNAILHTRFAQSRCNITKKNSQEMHSGSQFMCNDSTYSLQFSLSFLWKNFFAMLTGSISCLQTVSTVYLYSTVDLLQYNQTVRPMTVFESIIWHYFVKKVQF